VPPADVSQMAPVAGFESTPGQPLGNGGRDARAARRRHVKLDERPPITFADPAHVLTGPETTLFVNSLVAGVPLASMMLGRQGLRRRHDTDISADDAGRAVGN
jgi:hypothetical protein